MDSGSGPGCVFLAQVRNLWSVFASIDADGSGEVDFEEFFEWYVEHKDKKGLAEGLSHGLKGFFHGITSGITPTKEA